MSGRVPQHIIQQIAQSANLISLIGRHCKLKQRGNTSDLIYPVAELINFISHVMTLLPGDIIATGTPSGVGPMYPGDTVEVRIPAIGTLRNSVVKNST